VHDTVDALLQLIRVGEAETAVTRMGKERRKQLIQFTRAWFSYNNNYLIIRVNN
jgi:meiotically up-regulated gene 157 (Mug157) protein